MKEDKYREAFEIWLKKNPGKTVNDIAQSVIVEISTGEKICLGRRINTIRNILKGTCVGNVSEDQRKYWIEVYGLMIDNKKEREKEEWEKKYREAFEIWLNENPEKTINDISRRTKVTIASGEQILLGPKIDRMRRLLRDETKGVLDKNQREYWIEKNGLQKDCQKFFEEEYREAFEIWLNENPGKSMNDISENIKIQIHNDKLIPLGKRISTMRAVLRGVKKGNFSKDQFSYWIEKHGLSLEDKTEKNKEIREQQYRDAFEIWLEQNPGKNVNDVTQSVKITLVTGQIISLGTRITTMRGILRGSYNGKLTEDQKQYWIEKHGLRTEKNISSENSSFDIEKMKKIRSCLSALKKRRVSNKKVDENMEHILKTFNVNLEMLDCYLSRVHKKSDCFRKETLMKEDETLRSYCIKNNYNYDVIIKALRLHPFCPNDTLEQLINRSITSYTIQGQKEPATWIYEKYGRLVKHELLYLGLDSSSILKNMTKYTISLEEAIRHEIFKTYSKGNQWLEELYNLMIEELEANKSKKLIENDIAEKFYSLVTEYKLTKEEYNLLWELFVKYVDVIKQYQKVDVGLETNEQKRMKKIVKYQFDKSDIEDSFFIPLSFDHKVLLGKQSQLYQRRQTIRQFIIDWNEYTDEEKKEIIQKNNFEKHEIDLIYQIRGEIDHAVEKVKKDKIQ